MDVEVKFDENDHGKNSYSMNNIIRHLYNAILDDKQFTSRDIKFSILPTLLKDLEEAYYLNPVFILQLALYSKHCLNLTHFTNVIVAYASIKAKTKVILKDYFHLCVRQMKDVLEIVELCQILAQIHFQTGKTRTDTLDSSNNFTNNLKLTKELSQNIIQLISQWTEKDFKAAYNENSRKKTIKQRRKIKKKLEKKFSEKIEDFYYKETEIKQIEEDEGLRRRGGRRMQREFRGRRALGWRGEWRGRGRGGWRWRGGRGRQMIKRRHQNNGSEDFDSDIEAIQRDSIDDAIIQNPSVNLKKVIRYLRLKEPRMLVDKILGRKYPKNKEEFESKYWNSPEPYDESLLGKRMKLGSSNLWKSQLQMIQKKGKNSKKALEDLLKNMHLPSDILLLNLSAILDFEINPTYNKNILDILSTSDWDNINLPSYLVYNVIQQVNVKQNKPFLSEIKTVMSKIFEIRARPSQRMKDKKVLIFIDTSPCMDLKYSNTDVSLKELALLQAMSVRNATIVVFMPVSTYFPEGFTIFEITNPREGLAMVASLPQIVGVPVYLPTKFLENISESYDFLILYSDYLVGNDESYYENSQEFLLLLKKYRSEINKNVKFLSINLNCDGAILERTTNDVGENGNQNILIDGYSENLLSFCEELDNMEIIAKKIINYSI